MNSNALMTTRLRGRVCGAMAASFAAVALLAAPAPAPAAVTVGSDLSPAPTQPLGCGVCTWLNTALPGEGIVVPSYGVVTRWRARVGGSNGGAIRMSVIRPTASFVFRGISLSAPQSMPLSLTDTTYVFETRQPVEPGDRIGLESDGLGVGNLRMQAPPSEGVVQSRWMPALGIGQDRPANGVFTDSGEVMVNADIEPDADCDGFGDETQDSFVSGGCAPVKAASALTGSVRSDGTQVTLQFACALAGGTCANHVQLERGPQTEDVPPIGSAVFSIDAGAGATVTVPLAPVGTRLLKRKRRVVVDVIVSGGSEQTRRTLTIIGDRVKKKPKKPKKKKKKKRGKKKPR